MSGGAIQPGLYAQGEAYEEVMPFKLDATKWGINLYPINTEQGEAGASLNDVVIFANSKFTTKNYAAKGFNPTNYTLSVKHDGTTVCETMQSKAKETVFWRLEMSEDGRLRGVASIHNPDGAVSDYRIGGRLWDGTLGERVIKTTPTAVAASGAATTVKKGSARKGSAGAQKASVSGQPKKSLWQRILAWFRRKR
jgi:hypothetical protein